MPRRKGDCFLCGKISDKRCEKCNLVYYCSRDHFLCHHQKDYCFPYRIIWKSMGGGPECIVATRDIRPLELILFEESLAWGPSVGKSWSPKCPVCTECLLSKDKLSECGMCGLPVCDDLCQVGLNHNIECKILRAFRGSSFTKEEGGTLALEAVLLIRLLQARITNAKVFERCRFLLQRKFSENKTKDVKTESQQKLTTRRKKLLKFLRSNFGTAPNQEDLTPWVLDLVQSRAMTLSGVTPGGGHKFGSALFPTFSLVSHSCSPNAKFSVYLEHVSMSLQSKTQIRKGEEITISLVPTLEPTWRRRERIYRDYSFYCTCERCQDPSELNSYLSALVCQKCNSNPALGNSLKEDPAKGCLLSLNPLDPMSDWSCKVHSQTRVSSKGVIQLVQDLQSRLYSQGRVTTLVQLQECLVEMGTYLHPHHAVLMTAKGFLLQCYSQLPTEKVGLAEQVRMKELCLEQLEVLGKVDSGFPDWKGDILKHFSTAELNMARINLESGAIQRPEFLGQVRKAMSLVQEGLKCKSCIKIDRSVGPATLDDMVSELSDSSYMSDASIQI